MKIPPYVSNIARILHKNGYQAWVVGGSIRDLMLGKTACDYDIATDALPEKVMKVVKRVIPTGIKHGTVTVLFKGQQYEVTTFRIEGDYSNSRHPDNIRFCPSIFPILNCSETWLDMVIQYFQKVLMRFKNINARVSLTFS